MGYFQALCIILKKSLSPYRQCQMPPHTVVNIRSNMHKMHPPFENNIVESFIAIRKKMVQENENQFTHFPENGNQIVAE